MILLSICLFFDVQRCQFLHDHFADADQHIQLLILIVQICMETSLNAERQHNIFFRIILVFWKIFFNQTLQFRLQTVSQMAFFCTGKQNIDQRMIGYQRNIQISRKHIRIFKWSMAGIQKQRIFLFRSDL